MLVLVFVLQLVSGYQEDPSYLYIERVLGSIPFRSDGEYEMETRRGSSKVEIVLLDRKSVV